MTLEVGQKGFLRNTRNRRGDDDRPATVVKVARKYATVTTDDQWPREIKVDKETGRDADRDFPTWSFLTPEIVAAQERLAAAWATINDAGFERRYTGTNPSATLVVAVADFIEGWFDATTEEVAQ